MTAWCAGWAGPGSRAQEGHPRDRAYLLKIAYAVLKSGRPYQEPGADF
jgi:hypothetical protein